MPTGRMGGLLGQIGSYLRGRMRKPAKPGEQQSATKRPLSPAQTPQGQSAPNLDQYAQNRDQMQERFMSQLRQRGTSQMASATKKPSPVAPGAGPGAPMGMMPGPMEQMGNKDGMANMRTPGMGQREPGMANMLAPGLGRMVGEMASTGRSNPNDPNAVTPVRKKNATMAQAAMKPQY